MDLEWHTVANDPVHKTVTGPSHLTARLNLSTPSQHFQTASVSRYFIQAAAQQTLRFSAELTPAFGQSAQQTRIREWFGGAV
jgi:hypothetical protein